MLASLKRAVLGPSKLDLRRLILLLALTSVFLMLANSLFASYRVQREVLIEKTLETNYVYATKIALTVDEFLAAAQQQLKYAAGIIANHYDDQSFLQAEALRLKQQTDSFNSVVIVDGTGVVRATDPDLRITGEQLESAGALQSLAERKPLINSPFVSLTGKLVLAVSLVTADVDHFKRINDTYGHDMGDEVLRRMGNLMRSCSRSGDLLCRIGGEEFALLLPDTDPTVASDVAERLRQLVERTPFDPVGNITISLGVAHWPLNVQSIDELLKRSDEALYRAKRNGRNRVVMAT